MARIGFQPLEGYAFGALQPTALLRFPAGRAAQTARAEAAARVLTALDVPRDAELFAGAVPAQPAADFIRCIAALNRHCGDRRFTPVTVFQEGDALCYALPTLSTDLSWHTLSALSGFLDRTAGRFTPAQVVEMADKLRATNAKFLLGGTNAMNMLDAAAARRVPFRIFRQNYLIFGYGSGSSIFKSSITDRETSVGVSLAHSKVDTNRLLRLSGLPVPDQARIQTLEQAAHFAAKFGYPVVLKPEMGSQGRGIYANIRDAAELAECFERARQSGDILLVEKHVPGDHYRVNLMGDALMMALRRRAPEVTGDGVSSLRALIEELNRDPERLDPNSSRALVALDEDLERCLIKQEITLDAVPEKGRQLYLKSISNRSRGGSQVHVEDVVHPENLALCARVARIMRLDVVGIDLLSPDLSQPWHTNGAVICEVNAQPQLGYSDPAFYWRFMKRYLRPAVPVRLRVSRAGAAGPRPALFDTDETALHLDLPAAEVLRNGAPVQYFDSLEIAPDIAASDRERLTQMLVSVPPEADVAEDAV